MFNSLIDTLNERGWLREDEVTLLRNLNLNSYQQIIDLLNSASDQQTILALASMMRYSFIRSHEFNWDDVVPALVSHLHSTDWKIRHSIIETIGELKVYDQLQPVAAIATFDENDDVRSSAIYFIAHWGQPQSAGLLIPLASNTNKVLGIREAAIEALSIIGSPEAIAFLITLLHDETPLIRFEAVIALHNASDPVAIPHLEKLLADESRCNPVTADYTSKAIHYLSSRRDQN